MSGLGGDELFAGYSHYGRIMAAEPGSGSSDVRGSGGPCWHPARTALRQTRGVQIPGDAIARAYYAAAACSRPARSGRLFDRSASRNQPGPQ